MSPPISIIIVNWNRKSLTEKVLYLLHQQTFQDFEILLMDNGSTDGSADDLKSKFPEVHLHRLNANLGFSIANNLGVQRAQSPWVVLLNNDALPEPDWLENLFNAALTHSEFTFFGSKLLQANVPNLLDGVGDVYHISGLAWRDGYNFPLETAPVVPREIFSPTAAAAIYSRQAFLDVGGFDEDFFMYHEDVDLGFRLRLRGHRALYVPDAVVYHQGSASTGVKSDFAIYYGHRNLVWSYVKNMPGKLFLRYLPAHLFANLFFLMFYTLQGHGAAISRAKRDALKGMARTCKKRREIQSTRTVSEDAINAVLNHSWITPYTLGFRARHNKHKMQG